MLAIACLSKLVRPAGVSPKQSKSNPAALSTESAAIESSESRLIESNESIYPAFFYSLDVRAVRPRRPRLHHHVCM